MSRWYLDENDRDIYLKDDKGTRWNYNTKELVRILNDLEAKLEESEQSKESYRLQDNDHHSKLWQFYSRLGVEAFGADIHEKALEEFGKHKQQLADTEAQNKRVLEKIDLIVRSNQELEKEQQQLKNKLHTSEQETMHFQNKYFAEKQIAIEELQKVKEFNIQQVFSSKPLDDFIDNQINQLKEMK